MKEPVVETAAEAVALPNGAALVLEPLREYLDELGLGDGPVAVRELGEGHSNLTFLLERRGVRLVLRRPPRGQLAKSANDVLREARVLTALGRERMPVPAVLARCENAEVIGAPFFLMTFVDHGVPATELGALLERPEAGRVLGVAAVAGLARLHEVPLAPDGLGGLGRPDGYLKRQLGTFSKLLSRSATRPLPELELVGEWLRRNVPEESATTFVHGDYRVGNLLFDHRLGLAAILDWEMATVGDPLADLGYLIATWAETGDPENPMLALSALTRRPGFPTRRELVRLYEEAGGHTVANIGWYEVLALWKSAIFLEGSHRRYLAGASADPFFAELDRGVPAIAEAAVRRAGEIAQ